ncbi:MAG: response regulator [Gemmatimonadetes bacterium]|nr:response regulator [Gemmatimonadota bacterium]
MSAADGAEALALLEHNTPDLILLDLFMSGMDGLEVLRRLGVTGNPIPPVIALTGYVDHQYGVGRTAELLGAKSVLLKPFTKEQLERAIASVLRPVDAESTSPEPGLDWVPRRVIFVGAASLSTGQTRQFNVQLKRITGESFVGAAGGETPMSELRGPAEATVDALRKVVGKAAELTLKGLLPVDAMGQNVFVAALEVVHDNRTHRLFGVSPVTEDRMRAAALATMNAANRFLGLG